jgi:hypothetical protein
MTKVGSTVNTATVMNYVSGRPAFGEPATVTGIDGDVIQDARVHRHCRELERRLAANLAKLPGLLRSIKMKQENPRSA